MTFLFYGFLIKKTDDGCSGKFLIKTDERYSGTAGVGWTCFACVSAFFIPAISRNFLSSIKTTMIFIFSCFCHLRSCCFEKLLFFGSRQILPQKILPVFRDIFKCEKRQSSVICSAVWKFCSKSKENSC